MKTWDSDEIFRIEILKGYNRVGVQGFDPNFHIDDGYVVRRHLSDLVTHLEYANTTKVLPGENDRKEITDIDFGRIKLSGNEVLVRSLFVESFHQTLDSALEYIKQKREDDWWNRKDKE